MYIHVYTCRISQEQGGALVTGWRSQQGALEKEKIEIESRLSQADKIHVQTQQQLKAAENKFAEVRVYDLLGVCLCMSVNSFVCVYIYIHTHTYIHVQTQQQLKAAENKYAEVRVYACVRMCMCV